MAVEASGIAFELREPVGAFMADVSGLPPAICKYIAGPLLTLAKRGFAAAAACLGARLRGSSIERSSSLVTDLLIGFIVISGLTIVGHVISVGPGWMTPFGWMTQAAGIAVEYVAWTIGLGAALSGRFVRPRATPPPMPAPSVSF